MSGDPGSIDLGYPAAIGPHGDRRRWVGQCLAEITTAVRYGIPNKHVLLVNGSLGKIGKELDVDHPGVEDPDRHLGVEPDPSLVAKKSPHQPAARVGGQDRPDRGPPR